MGHSSLFGAERANLQADGRDAERLGTGDNSDSGSDLMGLDAEDQADPGLPVDVAMSDDAQVFISADGVIGSSGDASGTGERRAAAGDSGREAADIGVDRVFSLAGDGTERDDEDADLAFIDDAVSLADRDAAADAAEDEDEDESSGSDAATAAAGSRDRGDGRPARSARRHEADTAEAYDRAVATPENPDNADLELDLESDDAGALASAEDAEATDEEDSEDEEGAATHAVATERRPSVS